MEVCIGSAGTIRHCAHWFRLVCVCVYSVCVCSSIDSLVDIYRRKNSGMNGVRVGGMKGVRGEGGGEERGKDVRKGSVSEN